VINVRGSEEDTLNVTVVKQKTAHGKHVTWA